MTISSNFKSSKLDISLDPHESFSKEECLRLKIVSSIIEIYDLFPTLHSFRIYHNDGRGFDKNVRWKASILQIAWDSCENIMQTQDYKKTGLIIYAYCNNHLIKLGHNNKNIPDKNNQLMSYQEIETKINEKIDYLNKTENIGFATHLINNKTGGFEIPMIDYLGYKDRNFRNNVIKFLGDELIIKINKINLENKIQLLPLNLITKETIKNKI